MRILIGCLLGISFLISCRSSEENETLLSERIIRIVATTSIVADLVREIGGPYVSVASLMGPGVDPHLYKASARDVIKMSEADIIVYNGLHLEGKMGDVFASMRSQGAVIIAIAELEMPDSLLIESEFFQGNYDPHIWFDINLWARAGQTLASTLARLAPARGQIFLRRGADYADRLMETHKYVQRKVAEIPQERRVLITSHDAFGYFGHAYGFDVHGLQGISTALEIGTADIQNLTELVVEREIPAMFIESSVSPRGIEAVQEAVRSKGFEVRIGGTLYGDALGGKGNSVMTYLEMVRYNIDTIASALSNDERG